MSKMSYTEYCNQLSAMLGAEVWLGKEDRQAFDLMFSVLSLNFANRGYFSAAEIKIASAEGVKSARDIGEALSARAENNTKFSVGSWRVYARNHSDQGHVVDGPDLPEELKDRKLQVRFLESWLGDHNGEPAEKVDRLRSLMSVNQNMQGQVRERFAMIDSRKVAIARLKKAEWQLDKMPIERITVRLEEVQKTWGLGDNIVDLMEFDIMRTLGGDDDMIIRDSVGKVAWESKLRVMQSTALLGQLSSRLESAHKNFYSPKTWF